MAVAGERAAVGKETVLRASSSDNGGLEQVSYEQRQREEAGNNQPAVPSLQSRLKQRYSVEAPRTAVGISFALVDIERISKAVGKGLVVYVELYWNGDPLGRSVTLGPRDLCQVDDPFVIWLDHAEDIVNCSLDR